MAEHPAVNRYIEVRVLVGVRLNMSLYALERTLVFTTYAPVRQRSD